MFFYTLMRFGVFVTPVQVISGLTVEMYLVLYFCEHIHEVFLYITFDICPFENIADEFEKLVNLAIFRIWITIPHNLTGLLLFELVVLTVVFGFFTLCLSFLIVSVAA